MRAQRAGARDVGGVLFGWGVHGVREGAGLGGAVVIVDVLSFSTTVDVAASRGALVVPACSAAEAEAAAARLGARCAGPRGAPGPTLSPASIRAIGRGATIVLASPNGATLSVEAGTLRTWSACLRNASAAAEAVVASSPREVMVVAAGERWPDGSLRPAVEDLIGAGGVLKALAARVGPQRLTPDARAAVGAFEAVRADLEQVLAGCPSGVELIERGFADDVAIAAALDVSTAAPRLTTRGYEAPEV